MKVTCSLSVVIAIIVLKSIKTNAACRWNIGAPGTECLLQCINMNPVQVNIAVEDFFNEAGKDDCRNSGIWLRLQSLYYPNNTIGSKWLTAEVKVFQLEVSLTDVTSVSADAFDSTALRTVKKISFPNFILAVIRNGTFNGLNELEVIDIKGAKGIETIERGVLDTLKELKEFTFEQSLNSNPEITINGLTGSQALSKLENVKIKYKLTSSIKQSTFIGLTNVKYLDLSGCQIEFIGENSFEPISNTIELLNLSGNKLTTLPELFNMMFPRNELVIRIQGNSLHCDCALMHLRLLLEQYQYNFDGVINCSAPPECKSNILESDCFNECDIPTTTTPRTTTTKATSPPNMNENFTMQCYKPNEFQLIDTVSVKRPIGRMTITETKNGEVNLNIENEDDVSSVIIWFGENEKSDEITEDDINCISKNEMTSIPITDIVITDNVMYSFCLMDKASTNVSPLDCASYVRTRHQTESIWLLESSKTLTVTLIVISLALNVVFGIIFAFWMFNFNPFSKDNSRTSTYLNNATDAIIFEPKMKDRTSNATAYTSNTMLTTRTSVPYDSFISPPLPDRPPKMTIFEEPVYASVEEYKS